MSRSLRPLLAALVPALTLATAGLAFGKPAQPDPVPAWTFAIIGDSRGGKDCNREAMEKVSRALADVNPELVFSTGDLIQGSKPPQPSLADQLAAWDAAVAPHLRTPSNPSKGIPTFPIRGNHEYQTPVPDFKTWTSTWGKLFVEAYPATASGTVPAVVHRDAAAAPAINVSVYYKNACFVLADNYDNPDRAPGPLSAGNPGFQADWLSAALKQADERNVAHVIVFAHTPLRLPRAAEPPRATGHAGLKRAMELFARHGVNTFVCGHEHYFEHGLLSSHERPEFQVNQFILGNTGAPLHLKGPKEGATDHYGTRYDWTQHEAIENEWGVMLGRVTAEGVTYSYWYVDGKAAQPKLLRRPGMPDWFIPSPRVALPTPVSCP